MHTRIIGLITLALVVGCHDNSLPGGPGATEKQPAVGQGENTFEITVPAMETNIKQGETKAVTIALKRGKGFTGDVLIDVDELPQGITVSPMSVSMKESDSDKAKLEITAAKDAAVGHHKIIVWGN